MLRPWRMRVERPEASTGGMRPRQTDFLSEARRGRMTKSPYLVGAKFFKKVCPPHPDKSSDSRRGRGRKSLVGPGISRITLKEVLLHTEW